MLKESYGDIFQLLDSGQVQAIAHGCNGEGVMGAGVALEVRRRWPDLYNCYKQSCLLGGINPKMSWETNGKWIHNLYTQPKPGPCADLDLIRKALKSMDNFNVTHEIKTVALPWIGCGLGGLKPTQVKPVLEEILGPSPVDYTVVTYWPHSRPPKPR